jgi:hypothetical protein
VASKFSDTGILHRDLSSYYLKDIVDLDDWVIGLIPRLRADPSMLFLRVFYRIFRIKAGRYSARRKVGEILSEFAENNRKTYLQDIFQKINKNTNFEILRKKLYQRGTRSIYYRLADYIYSRCFVKAES